MEDRSYKYRPGDWNCPKCNYQNYSSRDRCGKCNLQKRGEHGDQGRGGGGGYKQNGGGIKKKKGDFYCSVCGELNFASRSECRKCGKRKDQDLENGDYQIENKVRDMKNGDWICRSCQSHNFASRNQCFQCNEPCVESDRHNSGRYNGVQNQNQNNQQIDGWRCFDCNFINKPNFDTCKCGRSKNQRREGDIDCPRCGKLNFSYRQECFQCKEPLQNNNYNTNQSFRDNRNERGGFRGGDRDRSRSRDRGYQRNNYYNNQGNGFDQGYDNGQYQQYYSSLPPLISTNNGQDQGYQPRQGDWYCSNCGFTNFASRQQCKGCGGQRA